MALFVSNMYVNFFCETTIQESHYERRRRERKRERRRGGTLTYFVGRNQQAEQRFQLKTLVK